MSETPGYRHWAMPQASVVMHADKWQAVLRDEAGNVTWACQHEHKHGRGQSPDAAEQCAGRAWVSTAYRQQCGIQKGEW